MELKQPQLSVGKFLGLLMHSRNVIHIKHLQTKSFAEHNALDELYNALPTFIDSIIEDFQGRTGNIINDYMFPVEDFNKKNPLEYVKGIRAYIDTNRKVFGDYSEIQNKLDELISQFNSTIYKLTNLK